MALAGITSIPAQVSGLSHRIGVLKKGADADVVMWDSHPLQLGATPIKVWIDGIVQIPVPPKSKKEENKEVVVGKGKEGSEWKEVPVVPNWDKERQDLIKWEGLPPLQGKKQKDKVVFNNVKTIWARRSGGIVELTTESTTHPRKDGLYTVVAKNGKIVDICDQPPYACVEAQHPDFSVDLRSGSISPGLMTFGSPLGLEEVAGEASTGDGEPFDAFTGNIPNILHDVGGIVRAMDALMFGTRNAL